jgi:iron-sulfur cluster repair protein YtfE (RIC family)
MTEAVITAETTVNEAVLRAPASLAVFSACGIDTCCGGSLAIGEAARRHGLDANALLELLREGGAEEGKQGRAPAR